MSEAAGTMQRMEHTNDDDANRQCGKAHPKRPNVRCTDPPHERLAHAETTTTLDCGGFTQETISWVDWDELDEKWHTLTMREATRAERVRALIGAHK